MKHSRLFAALIAISLTACGQKAAEAPSAASPGTTPAAAAGTAPGAATAMGAAPAPSLPAGHPPINAGQMPQAAPVIALTQKAQVLSAIDVPQYTYLEVMQDNKTRWLASTTVAVKKGDTIQFSDGNTLANFNSKTLNRTFPSITFVDRVVVANGKS